MALTGPIDGRPTLHPLSIIDTLTAADATSAICAALHGRQRHGRGDFVDLCLLMHPSGHTDPDDAPVVVEFEGDRRRAVGRRVPNGALVSVRETPVRAAEHVESAIAAGQMGVWRDQRNEPHASAVAEGQTEVACGDSSVLDAVQETNRRKSDSAVPRPIWRRVPSST